MPGTCTCGAPAYSPAQYMCRPCFATYMREWRKPRAPSENQKRKHPARRTALNHKRDGKLKPQPCFRCGSSEKLEMHHEDYARPLDVMWLCRKCHVALHTERNRSKLIEAQFRVKIVVVG